MSDKEKKTGEIAKKADSKVAKTDSKDAKKAPKKKSDKNIWEKVKKFFREYKSEMKKISWPTFPEVIKNSVITLVVVLIIGVVIWLFDWGASSARNVLLATAKGDRNVSNSDVSDGDLIPTSPTDELTLSNSDK